MFKYNHAHYRTFILYIRAIYRWKPLTTITTNTFCSTSMCNYYMQCSEAMSTHPNCHSTTQKNYFVTHPVTTYSVMKQQCTLAVVHIRKGLVCNQSINSSIGEQLYYRTAGKFGEKLNLVVSLHLGKLKAEPLQLTSRCL